MIVWQMWQLDGETGFPMGIFASKEAAFPHFVAAAKALGRHEDLEAFMEGDGEVTVTCGRWDVLTLSPVVVQGHAELAAPDTLPDPVLPIGA